MFESGVLFIVVFSFLLFHMVMITLTNTYLSSDNHIVYQLLFCAAIHEKNKTILLHNMDNMVT